MALESIIYFRILYFQVISFNLTVALRKSQDRSSTSTISYGHEPFATFKKRVLQLCHTTLGTSDAKFTIERMRGGSFNRVIGISVVDGQKPLIDRYVLRIPRFDDANLANNIAPLKFLRERTIIPTPDVIQFDTTTSNPLGSPYAIMTRLSGSSLWPSYPKLPYEMKVAIAKSLGNVYFELHSIRSVTSGKLTLSAPNSRETLAPGTVVIQPLDKLDTDIVVPYQSGNASNTTFNTICAILEHQKELAISRGPSADYELHFFKRFSVIASEMNNLGMLEENGYCLCHLDLEARNILVQQKTITGILDWDDALFAPLFMSCAPPMWLWAWDLNEDDVENEGLAGEIPSNSESRQLKELFEEAAGPTYLRYAYSPQYRLARTLFKYCIVPITTQQDFDAVALLRSEWAELRDSLNSPDGPKVASDQL
ncbi:hypothetical protein N7456_004314 [Penicillium angulare]|uniref:Aminoglycoside phosphotransferase domain-containing protein n=1 Tax=Penicillium angulare TaxID=116970 RepID=A0A9W9KI96_9EURO|nr:hypothetical protein N7456_004314 [Penicillium angulare]